VTFGYAAEGGTRGEKQGFEGYDVVFEGEVAAALSHALQDTPKPGVLNYDDLDRWSVAGASIITEHPWYPHILCELETARGCSRSVTGGCGFCTEYLYGAPRHRSVVGIAAEVAALSEAGARNFRLGRQPDLLTYGTTESSEFPEPDPAMLEDLFSSVREAAPELKTLHIDNVNPGTIAHHEEASRTALAVIVQYHTPGDVAAFGLESADPAVVAANNLKASAEEVLRAIAIVNEVGGVREEGIPHLLPGLNFVCGLAGETAATYEKNRVFLEEVQRRNLLIRRVNIGQLMPFEGTKA
jgi:radical SAM superfamily enzyme with C-terminal helix-hairpin-helix motif